MIPPLGADPPQKQHVRTLGLGGQPHFRLHLEARRAAVLDQVDEGEAPEVPEVNEQLHESGDYPEPGPSRTDSR